MKRLESKTVEVIEDPEPQPKVNDKPELKPGPEVVKLVSQQEEISPWPTEVVELPIKTLVDLPAELTMEKVPSLAAMRASFS